MLPVCVAARGDHRVEVALDLAQVGHVTLGDAHLREAAHRRRQDPRVAEDGDPGVGSAGVDVGQGLRDRRGRLRVDLVVEVAAVEVLARAALAQGGRAGASAGRDRPDEDVVVVAADGQRDELGAGPERVELGRHAGVLGRREVLGLSRPTGHVREARARHGGDDMRVVARAAGALRRCLRVRRPDARPGRVAVTERDIGPGVVVAAAGAATPSAATVTRPASPVRAPTAACREILMSALLCGYRR